MSRADAVKTSMSGGALVQTPSPFAAHLQRASSGVPMPMDTLHSDQELEALQALYEMGSRPASQGAEQAVQLGIPLSAA